LGSLPSIKRKESWKDVGGAHADNVVVKKVEKGVEPKSSSAIVFSGPFEYDQMHRVKLRAMAEILQRRLLETIREDLGGTYGIMPRLVTRKFPIKPTRSPLTLGVTQPAPTNNQTGLSRRSKHFKANGPTDQQVADEKETLLRDFESNSKLNNYLMNQISLRYEQGEDRRRFGRSRTTTTSSTSDDSSGRESIPDTNRYVR
jgi:zinc protease